MKAKENQRGMHPAMDILGSQRDDLTRWVERRQRHEWRRRRVVAAGLLLAVPLLIAHVVAGHPVNLAYGAASLADATASVAAMLQSA